MSNRGPANSESILVSPKVTVQCRSNSIEDKSIVHFGHNRAETYSSVVTTYTQITRLGYRNYI